MKNKSIIISLILILSTQALFASNAEVWTRLYRRSATLEQKEMVLQNIVKMDDRAVEPILMEALEEMNNNQEKFRGDRALMAQWVRMTDMIVKELGDLKTRDSEDLVWFVVTHPAESALLKANAMIALGNMRSTTYAPDLAMILRNLNFNTQRDNKSNAEIEAYGAVMSLLKMRSPLGFEPVFYAATGWYSRRTKDLAMEALKTMAEDPSDQVMEIMKDADFKTKKIALEVENASTAPAERKNEVAILALEEGLRYQTQDKREQDDLSKLRVEAMKILIANKSTDDAAVPFMKSIVERSKDANEIIYAYYTLGIIGSDAAVELLSEKLSAFNIRQADGLEADRSQLEYIKQIIKSIGMSKNSKGMGALTEVQFSNYTPAINRLAKQAMEELQ